MPTDHIRAVALYDWHAEITAACFAMVHHFEVLVRNAIDGVLGEGQAQEPIKDTWLMDFGVLQPDGVKQVILAVERLEQGKGITRWRVVAGVSFGFWAGLFSKRYEELAAATPSRLPPRICGPQGPDRADACSSNASATASRTTTACFARTLASALTTCC